MTLSPDERTIKSFAEMQQLGAEVAADLKPGTLLLLEGELGTGKTTFAQGLAKALGVILPVTSPSFTVTADYEVVNHEWLKHFRHADLYRLSDDTIKHDAAVQDIVAEAGRSDSVTVVEWADKLPHLAYIPLARRMVFKHGDSAEERRVEIQ